MSATIGRPTKYNPAFCALAVELGAEAKSKAQIAVRIGVTRETLDEWAKVYPAFSDALARARDLSQDWWETTAKDNLDNKNFNANLWSRSMAARFPNDYREKVEQRIDVTSFDGNITDDQIAMKLDALFNRIEARKPVVDDEECDLL